MSRQKAKRSELDHWNAVKDDHHSIMGFVSWLQEHCRNAKVLDISPELVDSYLEINRGKLDAERRRLLENT